MDMVLGLVGIIGFLIFLVLLVASIITKKRKRGKLIGLAVCFALFMVGVSMAPESTATAQPALLETQQENNSDLPEPETTAAIEITAEDVWAAYDENAVNADNLYKGKTLAVTGVILDITQDLVTKNPCVKLDAGDPYDLYAIQCFFDGSEETKAIVGALKDGQTITVVGECDGVPISNVQFSKCLISD